MYVCRYILGSGVTGVVGRLSKIQLPGQVIRTSKSSEPSIIHVYIYTHCIYIYAVYDAYTVLLHAFLFCNPLIQLT